MHKILLFLLLPFFVRGQCKAVTINSFAFEELINCKYRVSITATLAYGNASFIIAYKCGNDINQINKCFTWDSPSTTFVEEFIYCNCNKTIEPIILIHASSNCHGHICREVTLRNLAIKESEDSLVEKVDDKIIVTNNQIISTKTPILDLIIYSQNGSIVYNNKNEGLKFDIPDIGNGIYIVVINTKYKTTVRKILRL